MSRRSRSSVPGQKTIQPLLLASSERSLSFPDSMSRADSLRSKRDSAVGLGGTVDRVSLKKRPVSDSVAMAPTYRYRLVRHSKTFCSCACFLWTTIRPDCKDLSYTQLVVLCRHSSTAVVLAVIEPTIACDLSFSCQPYWLSFDLQRTLYRMLFVSQLIHYSPL